MSRHYLMEISSTIQNTTKYTTVKEQRFPRYIPGNPDEYGKYYQSLSQIFDPGELFAVTKYSKNAISCPSNGF